MAGIKLALVGESGSGKSTSLFNLTEFGIPNVGLDPKETLILSPTNKELPVKGGRKLYPSNLKSISEGLRYITNLSAGAMVGIINSVGNSPEKDKPDLSFIKNIIIDDAQYLQSLYLMDKVDETGYGKFTETAVRAYNPIKAVNLLKRNDLIVVFIYHTEIDEKTGRIKIKTSGKMVDSSLGGLDGLFTTLLYSECKYDVVTGKVSYVLNTHNSGKNTCKSPLGMFTEDVIPNDLGMVCKTMRDFYS